MHIPIGVLLFHVFLLVFILVILPWVISEKIESRHTAPSKTWCTERFNDKDHELYGHQVKASSWKEAQKVADKEDKGTVIGEFVDFVPFEGDV